MLAIGGVPGQAYRPRAWETNYEVLDLFDRGDHAGAKRVLTAALDTTATTTCSTTTWHAPRRSWARRMPRSSISRRRSASGPASWRMPGEDPDLASLHGLERFAQLVGEA